MPDQLLPKIIAHRGAARRAPANSLASIEQAIARGVDGIEVDIRQTLDGEFVLSHQASLPLITGRRQRIDRLKLEEIKRLALVACPVATLSEALEAVKGRAFLILDLKPPWGVRSGLDRLAGLLKDWGGADGSVYFRSYDTNALVEFHSLAPSVSLIKGLTLAYPGFPFYSDYRPRRGSPWGIDGVRTWDVHWLALSPQIVDRVSDLDGKLFVWLVNAPWLLERCRQFEVAGIITDRVDWTAVGLQGDTSYSLPLSLRTRGPVYTTYGKFLRGASLKCALVAGIGHAASIAFPLVVDPRFCSADFGYRDYPNGRWAFIVSAVLAAFVYRVVRNEGLPYYARISLVPIACAVAAVLSTVFFGPIEVQPAVLSVGLAAAGIAAAAVVIGLYEPLTRIAYSGEEAEPSEIRTYLELEASSWGTLGVQIFAAALGLLLGFWAVSDTVADKLLVASGTAFRLNPMDPSFDRESQIFLVAMSMGAQTSLYVLLAMWSIVGGAMKQSRLARSEILCIRGRMSRDRLKRSVATEVERDSD